MSRLKVKGRVGPWVVEFSAGEGSVVPLWTVEDEERWRRAVFGELVDSRRAWEVELVFRDFGRRLGEAIRGRGDV